MSGLSQLELDALCCSHEAKDDHEPSSPIGCALLARKRHRQAARDLPASFASMSGLSQLELDDLCCSHEATTLDGPSSPLGSALLARKIHRQAGHGLPEASGQHCEVEDFGGLSQSVLDDIGVPGQQAEDPSASSPLGSSLKAAKNRRRWGAPAAQQEDGEVPIPEKQKSWNEGLIATALACPASWGDSGSGMSQAELDAICFESCPDEATDSVRMAAAGSELGQLNEYGIFEEPLAPVSVTVIASPVRTKRVPSQLGSPCFSPPMRRRRENHKADAENFGSGTGSPARSPAKAFASIGSPGKSMDKASPGEILSPLRRSPCWKASPLSPVGLN